MYSPMKKIQGNMEKRKEIEISKNEAPLFNKIHVIIMLHVHCNIILYRFHMRFTKNYLIL